jgi:acetyl-CoA carboxylase biotin carboxylase subunit
MNTRLQVEHPVTELVTGLDLVHLQIRIAAGEKLPFQQEEVRLRGHAMECRIYAEDPDHNYFPSPGKITRLLTPGGPGIRLDSGMYEGWMVPLDYDPLLAKLIGYAENREQVMARLACTLDEYFVGGIKTNISLFRQILRDPDFRSARLDTGFLDRMLRRNEPKEAAVGLAATDGSAAPIAALSAGLFAAFGATTSDTASVRPGRSAPDPSNWKKIGRSEGLR